MMTDQHTAKNAPPAPPCPAAALRPEFRTRLLEAMHAERTIARASQLAPAPLPAGFRARLLAGIAAEQIRRRRHLVPLRWQYGAAACVVLCAMVGSLFCLAPAPAASHTLQATACRSLCKTSDGTRYCDTMTIVAADNSVLRVRSFSSPQQPTISEDVI